jgi:hypothetical protein
MTHAKIAAAAAARDYMTGISGFITPSVLKHIKKRSPSNVIPRSELQRMAIQARTTNTLKHTYGFQINSPSGWSINDWIELARIPSDFNYITILRQVNTFIGDITGRNFIRANISIFENNWIEFWLVYSPIDAVDQYVFNAAYGGNMLVGKPVWELSSWNDNKYQLGVPDNELTIPLLPGYNVSLFGRVVGITPESIRTYNFPDVDYVKGDLVEWNSVIYVCILNQNSKLSFRPDNDPSLYMEIGNIFQMNFSIWGSLEASVQSEQDTASQWQTQRTYIT